MVNGANVSCACSRSPNGISPYCHLGDGCVDVLIIKHSNILNNLRLLLRLSSKAKNVVRNLILKLPGQLRSFKYNVSKHSDAKTCMHHSNSVNTTVFTTAFTVCYMFQPSISSSRKNCTIYEG
jgi:hypothetical protein